MVFNFHYDIRDINQEDLKVILFKMVLRLTHVGLEVWVEIENYLEVQDSGYKKKIHN